MSFRECLEVRELADSTNRILLEEASGLRSFGSSIMALEQTSGRGRAGRSWQSSPGGLYISTLLFPKHPEGLALLGALSVVEILEAEFALEPTLRWPNDVLIRGQKVAGVLPAARYRGTQLERAVLGTGLNVHQSMETLRLEEEQATTIAAETQPRDCPEVIEVANLYLARLESNYHLLEAESGRALAEKCEPYLEGMGSEMVAVLVNDLDKSEREIGQVAGLGPLGELRLRDGGLLSALGPTERLRFR